MLIAGCALATPAVPGSGTARTEVRDLKDFDRVEIAIPVEIEIRKADSFLVELTLDDNLLPLVDSTVTDGLLNVSSKENLAVKAPSKLVISAPVISSVALAGAIDGRIDELGGDNVKLSLAGSTDISVGLQAKGCRISIAGSGKVSATGTCEQLNISIAGSGTVHTEEVPADGVDVSVSGSGDVFVQATQKLKVSIAGSGRVRYVGEPEITQKVAGSGEVSRIE